MELILLLYPWIGSSKRLPASPGVEYVLEHLEACLWPSAHETASHVNCGRKCTMKISLSWSNCRKENYDCISVCLR